MPQSDIHRRKSRLNGISGILKRNFFVLGNVFDNHIELLEEYNHWSNYDRYHLGINDYPANLYFSENVANVCLTLHLFFIDLFTEN